MKSSNYLIFRIYNQKFAIKTKQVINLLENVKILEKKDESSAHSIYYFTLYGLEIPIVNFHQLLTPNNKSAKQPLVLLLEIVLNNNVEIVGITIDEVIEVTPIDDILSYPFMNNTYKKEYHFKEAIVIHRNEPIVILNTKKLLTDAKQYALLQQKIFLSN